MIKTLNAKLLEAAEIDLLIPEDVFNANYANVRGLRLVKSVSEISAPYAVVLDAASPEGTETLNLASEIYTMGIGCRRGTSADEIENAVIKTLEKLGISMANVAKFATTIHKKDEKGLLDFAEKNSLTLEFIDDDTLNSIKTPNTSPKAKEQFGLNSVAEAAALASAPDNAEIITEKTVYGSVTTAVAAGTEL
jgi:cobalt-precorrin 5A hydrolase